MPGHPARDRVNAEEHLDTAIFQFGGERLNGMLWQLKRKCLVATLGCLPPGVRISFVLTDLLGYGPSEAAALLEIKESAYRVRLTRARKRIRPSSPRPPNDR